MHLKQWGILGGMFLILASCAGTKKEIVAEPEDMYTRAKILFDEKEYTESAELFDEIDKQHPYSLWAPRAQIMAAYAYYKVNKYDEAILTLDRFIQLHPGNRNTPYAFYLKGLCYFEQISNIEREQKMSENALATFNALIMRYPTSPYKEDAEKKISLIMDHLAGKEMEVGRYYEARKDYVPAMNRYQTVIKNYPDTMQVSEAYYRLGVCYYALGIRARALDTLKKMKKDFPSVVWTKKLERVLKD